MDSHAPWYKSQILQGIIAAAVLQGLSRSKVLGSIITSDQGIALVNWALDGITALALAFAAHARTTKPMPILTTSQAKADVANAITTKTEGTPNAQPIQPVSPPASPTAAPDGVSSTANLPKP